MYPVYNTVKWRLRIVDLWPDLTSSKNVQFTVFSCFFFVSMCWTDVSWGRRCPLTIKIQKHPQNARTTMRRFTDYLGFFLFCFCFFPPERIHCLAQGHFSRGADCLYPFQSAKHDLDHMKVFLLRVAKSKSEVAQRVLKTRGDFKFFCYAAQSQYSLFKRAFPACRDDSENNRYVPIWKPVAKIFIFWCHLLTRACENLQAGKSLFWQIW